MIAKMVQRTAISLISGLWYKDNYSILYSWIFMGFRFISWDLELVE